MENFIKRGEEIDRLIGIITERCATLFPRNWEFVAKQILEEKDLSATTDVEIHELMGQLVQLENEDPFIWLLNQG